MSTKNQIVPFDYGTHQLRTIIVQNEPYFLAVDICRSLDISDASKAVSKLDDDEKMQLGRKLFGLRGAGDLWLINESGLYHLTVRSNKPEAKKFRKWVTSEVLPEIRKTGKYQAARPAIAAIADGKVAILQELVEVLANERKISTISAQRIKKAYSFILQNQR